MVGIYYEKENTYFYSKGKSEKFSRIIAEKSHDREFDDAWHDEPIFLGKNLVPSQSPKFSIGENEVNYKIVVINIAIFLNITFTHFRIHASADLSQFIFITSSSLTLAFHPATFPSHWSWLSATPPLKILIQDLETPPRLFQANY